MVVGVEVAVGRVPRVAGLGGPHAVTDLQVAAEGHDVRLADRAAERGVAVQRRAVDHEVGDAGGRVAGLHAGGVGAFGCPDAAGGVREPGAGVGQALAQRELAQPGVEQRLERMRQRAAEQFDGARADELPQHRAAAVLPVLGKFGERRAGLLVFVNTEGAQRFR